MQWWIILLLILTIIFTILTIFFSFIYPNKLKAKQLKKDLKYHPQRTVVNPIEVKLFLNFKFNELENILESKEYHQAGVFGFYVNTKMRIDDYFYPIYLGVSQKDVWKEIEKTHQMILEHHSKFQSLDDYFKKTKQSVQQIRFFIIEDYNPENYEYWTEVLETKFKGFNSKIN